MLSFSPSHFSPVQDYLRDPLGAFQSALMHLRELALTWGRQALDHARNALVFSRAIEQPVWEAHALNQVGWYAANLGDFDTARAHCRDAVLLHRRHGNPSGEAATLDSLGLIAHRSGDYRQAVDDYRQALRGHLILV